MPTAPKPNGRSGRCPARVGAARQEPFAHVRLREAGLMDALVESVSVSILSSGGIKVPQDVQDGSDGGSREFQSIC